MSELLEKLVYEMVGLRRRVGALETLEAPTPAPSLLIGMIVPFSGTLGGANNHHPVNPATGQPDTRWHVCNGETVNGHATPDLRDRFVVGAGGSYAAGSKGGAATHTHGYSDVPSHTHTMESAGAHAHGVYYNGSGTSRWEIDTARTSKSQGPSADVTNTAGAHTHTINATGEASPETDSTSSLPPYVALVWVMKVA
jgi:microcystin-dependent protein